MKPVLEIAAVREGVAPRAALGSAVFCLAFALFQAALAAGAPLGRMAWGGSADVLAPPMRAASAGAAVYLLLAGAAMLARSGVWGRSLPRAPLFAFNLFLAVQLALNTAANLASRSELERYVMGGASTLGVLFTAGALIPRRRRGP